MANGISGSAGNTGTTGGGGGAGGGTTSVIPRRPQPVFNDYEWYDGETKTLIDIWLARQEIKWKDKLKNLID